MLWNTPLHVFPVYAINIFCALQGVPLTGTSVQPASFNNSSISSTLSSATSSCISSTDRLSRRPSLGPNHMPATSVSPFFTISALSPARSKPCRMASSSGSALSLIPETWSDRPKSVASVMWHSKEKWAVKVFEWNVRGYLQSDLLFLH